MMPATPAAAWVWPMLDLIEPSHSGRSADNPRCRLNSTSVSGVAITATPPARASAHSFDRRAWTARCTATSDEEQAVSSVTDGPSSPKTYDTLPEAIAPVLLL